MFIAYSFVPFMEVSAHVALKVAAKDYFRDKENITI